MIGFLVIFIGLSLLILIHEIGHFWVAKYFKMPVEEFGIGFPPRLFSWQRGGTRYSVNVLPLGGFVKLHGELEAVDEKSFVRQKSYKRAMVVTAGVVMNFLAGWFIMSSVFLIGAPPLIFIDQVAPGSPAAQAGLQEGDMLFNIATSEVANSEVTARTFDVQNSIDTINGNRGKEITIAVRRDGREFSVAVVPRENPPAGEGALGVSLRGSGVPRLGLWNGLASGFLGSIAIVWGIIAGLYQIVLAPSAVVGPVGIFNIAVHTGQIGWVYVLQLLGVISLNLAALNLLPIPALDGGRLLFIAIEKLRGRPFSSGVEIRANAIGFAFLIVLIIAVTIKDVAGLR